MHADGIARSYHEAGDLDELASEVERFGYRMDRTPLGPAPAACALRIARGRHFFCAVESTSVPFRNSFATPRHLVAFGVGLRSTAPWRYAGVSHGVEHIRLVPPDREAETVTRGPQVMAHFGFSRTWLEQYEEATRSAGLAALARADPGVLENLQVASRLRSLIAWLFSGDTPVHPRSEDVMAGLANAISHASARGARALPVRAQRHVPAYRTVQRAQRVVEDRLGGPLSLRDVCREVGVSRRTLERAFQEHLGLTPGTYLLTRRLVHARRLLHQARPGEVTARAAAEASGLHHAGRFSARYRALFGELPSETLRRL